MPLGRVTPEPMPTWLAAQGTPTNRLRRPPRGTGATAPRPTKVPSGCRYHTRRCRRAMRVRPAAQGTVYEKAPGVLVRITGQPPLAATVYQLQKLRCHLCGQVFTAEAPAEAGLTKYDATAASMIGLLKYGSGMPFNRVEGLQGDLGVPLPASTQWDVMEAVAGNLAPVFDELIRQAAQGEILHNDDTTVKILELMDARGRRETQTDAGDDAERAPGPVHLGGGRVT